MIVWQEVVNVEIKRLRFRPTYVQFRCIGYSRRAAALRAARAVRRDRKWS